MEHFTCSAEDRIQHVVRLQADTAEQYEGMLTYLGEKIDNPDSKSIFSIINTFLTKFDNSHKAYVKKIETNCASPLSPYSDASQFISSL